MSQVAAGYIVSDITLHKVGELAASLSSDKLWRMLRDTGSAVQPDFSDSGYVVAVAIAYLDEQGVALSCNLPTSLASGRLETDYGLLVCADADRAAAALDALAAVTSLDDELRIYYEEFTEDAFAEAGTAMQAAISFIKRGFAQVTQKDEWLLIFVG